MALSLGQLIMDRAKRDPLFKQQTLTALYRKLAKAIPSTAEWQRLARAITALENMK